MIKINGKYIRNIPEQVGKNKRDIFTLDTDLTALEVKVNEALVGVFHYKGSVATYGDLPASDNEVGDVYNVIDTGKNYAWDGSIWDDLGGLVDLSNYYTKAEANAEFVDLDSVQTITGEKTISDTNSANSPQLKFKNQYTTLGLYANGYQFRMAAPLYVGGSLNVEGNAFPEASGTRDIGSSTYAWKDLYLSGRIHLRNDEYTYIDGSNGTIYMTSTNGDIRCGAFFIPNVGNAYDLGSSTYGWKNLYLSGNLSNGTDTATVADIAALIAYAKAQGWIS